MKEHAGASGIPKLPAEVLESAVKEQVREVLRSQELVAQILPLAKQQDPSLDEARVTVAMRQIDTVWEQLLPPEQKRIIELIVEKVIVSPYDLEVRLRANGIERILMEATPPVDATDHEEVLA